MNKEGLIASISEKSKLTKKDAEAALKGFIETVEEAVARGEKVAIVGFGTFDSRNKAATERKHTFGEKKGEKYLTEAKTVPTFKFGKEFKDKVKNAK